MNRDEEHLKLLSIFHYVAGGLTGFFACIPIFHLIFGIVMLVIGLTETSGEEVFAVLLFGFFFALIPAFFILCGWTLAVCLIISGRYLARKERYKFCFAIACISCVLIPYGTVLGVFTIIVLMRPSVKELFVEAAA